MSTPMPSHPVVGTVTHIRPVYREFGTTSRRRSYGVGHRYTVKRPDGTVVEMTASEWRREVRKATPKNVNINQPEIVVGTYVGVYIGGGSWHGAVVDVTRDDFGIKPAALEGIFTGEEVVRVDHIEYVTRLELEQFRTAANNLSTELNNDEHALAQRAGVGSVYGSTEKHKEIRPEVDARRAKYRADFDALRQRFPGVTAEEAFNIG